MQRAANKAERLRQIEALLLAHSEGYTCAELARKLGVHRSTICRDLASMQDLYDTSSGKVVLDRKAYLVDVRFSLNEALALHLAARLLATRMDRRNWHASSAVRRLGLALQSLAPTISRSMIGSAGEMDSSRHWTDPTYVRVLENLTEAWAQGNKVRLQHRSESSRAVSEYIFSTYFIEANAVGQATYVIGWREPPDALRTLKIERIEEVEVLAERYEIPDDFDPYAMLAGAWGIWFKDTDPVKVTLRFSGRVAARLKETLWHHTQVLEDQPDGCVLCHIWVDEPREMMPWVRSWGADVEVLSPADLRAQMEAESRRLAEIYGG